VCHDTAVDLFDANDVIARHAEGAPEALVVGLEIGTKRQCAARHGMRRHSAEGIVGQHLSGWALAPSPPGDEGLVNHGRHLSLERTTGRVVRRA
jgi:hypothetical protein